MSAIQNNPATVGTTPDIVNRLFVVLAPWFGSLVNAPTLNALLNGIADAFSFCYQYLAYAANQTRILTATDGFLDLIAWDYFGTRFLRRQLETDASFRARILKEILRPRATRAAMHQMLQDLTGRTGEMVTEPWNTGDYGSYGTGQSGYGMGLGYGSLALPNQIFVLAYRPFGEGIPLASGFGSSYGGYGVGSDAYVNMSQISGPVTDVEISSRVAQTVAAGVTAWLDITT